MPEHITFLDALIDALERAGNYNKNDQVAPAAVLWPDKERQWEPLIPLLRERLPLLMLGPYAPAQRTGPAYWLRCMIARTLPEDKLPDDITPILYLPGISRQEIRAVEECPRVLQPLAELQYRGVLWTQRNSRDWTIAAFLQSKDGGLGIEVGADQATKDALQRALLKLAAEPLAHLRKAAPFRAPFLDALLAPDEVRSLLLWLNDPEKYPKQITPEEWAAFCGVCQGGYQFHPEKDGPIHAAELLGQRYGKWYQVWERYTEAPHAYPNVPDRLRAARPMQLALEKAEGWPQDNEDQEKELRQSLRALEHRPPKEARAWLDELEERHGPRREWVWAQLGHAPLAKALKSLAELAKAAEHPIGGVTLEELVTAYAEHGWQADSAVLKALAAVERLEDVNAVKAAVRAVYRPWLEATALAFQERVKAGDLPQGQPGVLLLAAPAGTCILFSDALRYDAGQCLASALEERGYGCQVVPHLAALPAITATAKPALSPVATALSGKGSLTLTPVVAATGSALTAEAFRKLLVEAGHQVLQNEDELGDPSGKAWTEMGAIDRYGHQHGWKIAHHVWGELRALQRRVEALLDHGWTEVIVVTDHGWLMLPGGLPKANLPEHLTVMRGGRYARLKAFSDTDQQTVAWFWDEHVRIAMAPGICCYEAGKEYEHGGLSLQECIVPVIRVAKVGTMATVPVRIEEATWRGLRCAIRLSGATSDMAVDIRTKAGDAATSLVVISKSPEPDGTVSLLVGDEDRMGEAAFVAVVGKNGLVCAQALTTIGG